jgi:hypothetical protein
MHVSLQRRLADQPTTLALAAAMTLSAEILSVGRGSIRAHRSFHEPISGSKLRSLAVLPVNRRV